MSLIDGMAAINLEMPDRVPRTEYSVEVYWDLIKLITGIPVKSNSDKELKTKATNAFRKAWNYDFVWNILVYNQIFDGHYTKMGHAEYAQNGIDFNNEISSPFKDADDVLAFDPLTFFPPIDKKLWTGKFNDNYAEFKKDTPDAVNMTGIYSTCMSGLIELFGWDNLLMAAGQDEKKFGELTNRYTYYIQQYFEALALCDSPIVMVHDDIVWTNGAFLHPDFYRTYIFPNYKRLFKILRDSGKKIIFTSDGNYTQFIDDIAGCGINGFVMEPLTDMKYIAERYGKTHCFVGNADTRVLLSGSKEDIYNEVKRCMDIGKKYPGFFMAVGNHIPSNTPIDNVLYYNDIYNKLSKR